MWIIFLFFVTKQMSISLAMNRYFHHDLMCASGFVFSLAVPVLYFLRIQSLTEIGIFLLMTHLIVKQLMDFGINPRTVRLITYFNRLKIGLGLYLQSHGLLRGYLIEIFENALEAKQLYSAYLEAKSSSHTDEKMSQVCDKLIEVGERRLSQLQSIKSLADTWVDQLDRGDGKLPETEISELDGIDHKNVADEYAQLKTEYHALSDTSNPRYLVDHASLDANIRKIESDLEGRIRYLQTLQTKLEAKYERYNNESKGLSRAIRDDEIQIESLEKEIQRRQLDEELRAQLIMLKSRTQKNEATIKEMTEAMTKIMATLHAIKHRVELLMSRNPDHLMSTLEQLRSTETDLSDKIKLVSERRTQYEVDQRQSLATIHELESQVQSLEIITEDQTQLKHRIETKSQELSEIAESMRIIEETMKSKDIERRHLRDSLSKDESVSDDELQALNLEYETLASDLKSCIEKRNANKAELINLGDELEKLQVSGTNTELQKLKAELFKTKLKTETIRIGLESLTMTLKYLEEEHSKLASQIRDSSH